MYDLTQKNRNIHTQQPWKCRNFIACSVHCTVAKFTGECLLNAQIRTTTHSNKLHYLCLRFSWLQLIWLLQLRFFFQFCVYVIVSVCWKQTRSEKMAQRTTSHDKKNLFCLTGKYFVQYCRILDFHLINGHKTDRIFRFFISLI